jgi:hypothetical protein
VAVDWEVEYVAKQLRAVSQEATSYASSAGISNLHHARRMGADPRTRRTSEAVMQRAFRVGFRMYALRMHGGDYVSPLAERNWRHRSLRGRRSTVTPGQARFARLGDQPGPSAERLPWRPNLRR